MLPVDLGEVCLSGVPCVDFSPMGQRRGLSGPSGVVILTWVRMLLDFQPAYIILEEVVQFRKHGLPMVIDLMNGVYSFESATLDPKLVGWPVSRPRLYFVSGCTGNQETRQAKSALEHTGAEFPSA